MEEKSTSEAIDDEFHFKSESDFSYDVALARKHMNTNDAVSLVLRALLYVEHSINEIVLLSLKRKESIRSLLYKFSCESIAFHGNWSVTTKYW